MIKESGLFLRSKPLIFVRYYNAIMLWPGYQEHKTIAFWRHFLNAVHTAWQISWKNPAQTMFPFLLNLLGKLFQSYYIRLRMCTATASVDRIELHPSLTNWMRDSKNRLVSSWQFCCFLCFITWKSAAIAFYTGGFNANQWWWIKLGSFASRWKKDQTINRSWIWEKSSHEEGAHGGKLTAR